jgi:hypothetical protein
VGKLIDYVFSRRAMLGMVSLIALVILAGCGTSGINQMAMEAHHEALLSQRMAMEQHSSTCATNAAGCADDMCRVAVTLACALGQPEYRVSSPQLRSPGEEFARGFGPIASLASTGLQVWGAGWLVDRSGRNATDLVGAVGGVVGQVQGPIDNSINVGGNYGDTRGDEVNVGGNYGDTRGDEIGGDYIGGDQRIGDDAHDSCVGDSCRNTSPGPWEEDHSTGLPPDPDG